MADIELPEELRYSEHDEWARDPDDDNRVVIGVTDFAQQQLGDVVYVELPEIGATLSKGEPFGVIESVKAVADLFAPISGDVVDVNRDLVERPELVNEDCYGEGWILAVEPSEEKELDDLFDADSYRANIASRSG